MSFIRNHRHHVPPMHAKRRFKRGALLILACAMACTAVPAQSYSFALLAPAVSVNLLLSVPSTSGCFQYVYDKNGNRISSTTANVSTGATVWGSATYGCATWGP